MTTSIKQTSSNPWRLVAMILGSVLFLPVSCVTGVVAGTHIISHIEARDSLRGESPHRQAYVAAVLPGPVSRTVGVPWASLEDLKKENPQATFLLPEGEGQFTLGQNSATVSFIAVAGTSPVTQQIDVTMQDDTSSFFKYDATREIVSPKYTRLFYHGYMFVAIPYALLLAAGLYLLGLKLRRKTGIPRV